MAFLHGMLFYWKFLEGGDKMCKERWYFEKDTDYFVDSNYAAIRIYLLTIWQRLNSRRQPVSIFKLYYETRTFE